MLPLLLACTADGPRAAPLAGQRLEVLATWSGTEQEQFTRVLDGFAARTGAVVTYTAAPDRLPERLMERIAAGRPPDVAFLPQPGLLRELADRDRLVPLDDAAQQAVGAHFPRVFQELGRHRGQSYGVWFKAANKSLVWYHLPTFERLGVVPPRDLDGLHRLVGRLAADGTPAFAVSPASGWTLTDWFENLHVRLAGLDAYDALAEHRVPWTGPAVLRTLEALGELLAPPHVTGAADSDFAASVRTVFGAPSAAAMVMQGDFVRAVLAAETTARLGVEADVFPFPAGPDGTPVVVGGGDVAVQLRPSPAAAALLQDLATPEAAAVWAAAGGFVSPNLDLDLSVYPDDVSRTAARRLLEAGDGFRFDLSDLQPAAFGASEEQGMSVELRRFLVERDPVATAGRLEAAARAAGAGAR